MKYEIVILNLFKNGYLTTKDVTNNNISRTYLTKLVKENKIERVSRGIYIKKNELTDEFIILQSKSKNAIYSNTTALYLYGLSNRILIKYDITTAHTVEQLVILDKLNGVKGIDTIINKYK